MMLLLRELVEGGIEEHGCASMDHDAYGSAEAAGDQRGEISQECGESISREFDRISCRKWWFGCWDRNDWG